MKLIWVKSNAPLSVLIRWGLKEPCSHFAVVFDDKFVIHSDLMGVHLDWWNTFKKSRTVVHEKKFHLPLPEEEKMYQGMLDAHDEKGYDFGAFFYFIWRGFLNRVFKRPFPIHNSWGSKHKVLCTEVARFLPDYVVSPRHKTADFGMVSPERLWKLMK